MTSCTFGLTVDKYRSISLGIICIHTMNVQLNDSTFFCYGHDGTSFYRLFILYNSKI